MVAATTFHVNDLKVWHAFFKLLCSDDQLTMTKIKIFTVCTCFIYCDNIPNNVKFIVNELCIVFYLIVFLYSVWKCPQSWNSSNMLISAWICMAVKRKPNIFYILFMPLNYSINFRLFLIAFQDTMLPYFVTYSSLS